MKILIVEDDPGIAETLRDGLSAESHNVELASDGAAGSFLARSFEFDAVILDYSLPKKNGLAVCKEIRESGKSTPIIFLSVTDDPEIKVSALENGADDYMTKPFSLQELYARLKAVSRRPAAIKERQVQVYDLKLDPDKHIVERAGKRIHTTRKEFNLLEYFMNNPGRVLSRALLLEHVWTAESNPFSNTVEAHIRNLRKKINIGKRANLIANLPGRGYVMDTPENLAKL